MDETLEKLVATTTKEEEAEKEFKDKEQDVNTAARRLILLEEEARNSEVKLAACTIKVATMSKEADKIVREARVFETRTMNNEVEIETLDKDLREARRIGECFIITLIVSYCTMSQTHYDTSHHSGDEKGAMALTQTNIYPMTQTHYCVPLYVACGT